MLIQKTVEIALEKEIIKSKTIIVDATHTKARYNKNHRKNFYKKNPKSFEKQCIKSMNHMKEKFPPKTTTNELEDELDYCQKVIQSVEKEETIR